MDMAGWIGEKSSSWDGNSGTSQSLENKGVERACGDLAKSTGSGTIMVLIWLCHLTAV